MNDLSALTAGVWNVDPSHSRVGFVGRHLMISKVRGNFAEFTANLVIAADPLQSTLTASVSMASVATGDDTRDAHLKNTEFFDVDNYPTMDFVSTGIKKDGANFVLLGDLTIKGTTRHVEFDLEFEGVSADPWGGTRAGFSAEAEVNRKDWGLEWNVALETGGVLVGEKIKIQLEIEAVRA